MDSQQQTLPPLRIPSKPSSIASRRSGSSTPKTPLSLDLSDLPPLITPSPPSNTLLITNLDDKAIFLPQNLQTIRDLINRHVSIYTWSPLKSFRRIIVSFFDVASAKLIKQTLDNEIIFDCRVRIYFGAETKIQSEADRHLQAPKSDKLFFISPPPSPPHGWEMRNEEPPNKEVHAEDLAQALSRLHARNIPDYPVSPDDMDEDESPVLRHGRHRSGSTTIVYHPKDHGDSAELPAISVEDTTESDGDYEYNSSPMEDVRRSAPILHTSRPPVELMEH